MNLKIKTILLVFALVIFTGSLALAKKPRKLPLGAYVKSAKIEILSGDFKRYKTAEALLDSLFMYYGPHAEALHLIGQIMVDYIDKAPNPQKKKPYIEKLIAYNDSLHLCCDSKDIKKKYKKNCKKFIEMSDSLLVKYWRESYNAGIEQMDFIDELVEDKSKESDSSAIVFYQTQIDANVDSSIINMKLAIMLNGTNYKAYIGAGSIYEKILDYENALIWLKKGLEITDDRGSLLLNIAYNHIQLNQFCEATPYFREHIEINPTDTLSMGNLAICFNNCKMYDSALAVNHQILSIAPGNADALNSVGRFFNEQVRVVSDSVSHYQLVENDEQAEHWKSVRNEMYDSSMTYFKKVTEVTPKDDLAWEQYGRIAALKQDFSTAANAFTKITELKLF